MPVQTHGGIENHVRGVYHREKDEHPPGYEFGFDFLIVYFNETESLPIPGLIAEEYKHAYRRGWNTQFREGADLSNVNITSPSSATNQSRTLELSVSPAHDDHLVMGISLRTSRRDIQYGSFTSLLRSPGPWAGDGGSTLSMSCVTI